jgi:hypothetical protein
VRETLAFVLLACACGAAMGEGRARGPQKSQASEDAPDLAADASDRSPDGASDRDRPGQPDRGFSSLEAAAPSLAPGMRQAVERESRAGDRVELLRSAAVDTCVRVAFEGPGPVLARLTDSTGATLAETRAPAVTGALGDRGPVCVRKGDSISAGADGAAGRVRWIVWSSP